MAPAPLLSLVDIPVVVYKNLKRKFERNIEK
jgi:hypothetical protein